MCKKALTLETITDKSVSDCKCGGECGGECGGGCGCGQQTDDILPSKPFAVVKETAMEAVDTVKTTAENSINMAKNRVGNDNLQKAVLAVIGIAAIYVILK